MWLPTSARCAEAGHLSAPRHRPSAPWVRTARKGLSSPAGAEIDEPVDATDESGTAEKVADRDRQQVPEDKAGPGKHVAVDAGMTAITRSVVLCAL
jgi:hypothetical protein